MKVTSYLTALAGKLAAAGIAVLALGGAPASSHAAPPAPKSADDAVHKADEHKDKLHKESAADKAIGANHTEKAASAVDRAKSDATSGVNSAKEGASNAARNAAKDTKAEDSRGRDRDRDSNAAGTDRSSERRDDSNDRRNGGQRDRDANSGPNRSAGDNRNDRSNERRRFSTDRNLRNENVQGRDRDDRNAENRNDRDRNRDNRNGNDRNRDDRNVRGRNGRAAVGANGQVRAGAGVNTRNPNLGIGWGNAASGLVVSSIAARSLGAGMGLRQGDQIVSVGGRQFNNQAAFNQYLYGVRPGVRLPLIVSRGGQQQTLYWTPTNDFVQAYQDDGDDRDVQQPAGNQSGPAYLGVQFDNSVRNAAVIAAVTPDGPADKAGLQPGDAILGINGQEVHSPGDVTQLVSQLQAGDSAKLSIGHQAVSDVDVELGARPQAGGVQAQPNVQRNQLAPPVPNAGPVQGQPAPLAPPAQPGLPPQPAAPGVAPGAPDAPPAPPANVNGAAPQPQVQPTVQPNVQPAQPPAPGPVRGRILNGR